MEGVRLTARNVRNKVEKLVEEAWKIYYRLTPIQRLLTALAGTCLGAAGIVFLIFHDDIFQLLVEFSKKWHDMKGGSLLMFFLIVVISFPPLIGYSTLASLCGMMYGFPHGWPFLAFSTIVGSSVSFLTFRFFFSGYAQRLASGNAKFAALTRTMQQDRFTLLWMIRLCPLPYSLSNGALSSIPSVSFLGFFTATAVTSPKLLIHIFVGDRIARLGTEKDTTTKIVDYLSITAAGLIGTITAYIIYIRTMERAEGIEVLHYNEMDDSLVLDSDVEFEISDEEDGAIEHFSDNEQAV